MSAPQLISDSNNNLKNNDSVLIDAQWDDLLKDFFHVRTLDDLNMRHGVVNMNNYQLVKEADPGLCENYLREMLRIIEEISLDASFSERERLKKWRFLSKMNREKHKNWPYNPIIFVDYGKINVDFTVINENVMVMFLCSNFLENIPDIIYSHDDPPPEVFPSSPFFNGRRKGEQLELDDNEIIRTLNMYLAIKRISELKEIVLATNIIYDFIEIGIIEMYNVYKNHDLCSWDKTNDESQIYRWVSGNYFHFDMDHPGEKYNYKILSLFNNYFNHVGVKSATKI